MTHAWTKSTKLTFTAAALLVALLGCSKDVEKCTHCGTAAQPESGIEKAVSPITPEAMPVKTNTDAQAVEECTINTPLKPGIPGSPGNLITSSINPNGDSELSHLMRKMVQDLQVLRNKVMNKQVDAKIPAGHKRILCSWPTDLKSRNPLYGAMANTYLTAVRNFNRAKRNHAKYYDAVIDACASCHKQTCRGPLAIIEPLYLKTPTAP